MTVHLEDTTADAVSFGIGAERFAQGSGVVGRVLTCVIVADESDQSDAMRAAVGAARLHPCRILVAIPRPARGAARLDAAITVGGGDGLGEVVELRMSGPLAHHVESVVLPLLVPDSPTVVWWPGTPPAVPSQDPVGALARRRITDSAMASRPLAALELRRQSYVAGDTDLAWTRATPWRALLAAALDQPHDPVVSVRVESQAPNPSGALLAAWLRRSLRVPVRLATSRGPGITAVTITTTGGDIAVSRPDGRVATIARPGFPDREAALHRRTTEMLIAEELRRLDPDEIYGETLAALADPEAVAPGLARRALAVTSGSAATAAKAPAAARARTKGAAESRRRATP
jgi:glucose-6-phosphate dehydrogenase assembly protein OpcA